MRHHLPGSTSLGLHVELEASSGLCFGVGYAIELAEEQLTERGYLYCLGDLVHNDEEVQRLGLRIIDYEQLPAPSLPPTVTHS